MYTIRYWAVVAARATLKAKSTFCPLLKVISAAVSVTIADCKTIIRKGIPCLVAWAKKGGRKPSRAASNSPWLGPAIQLPNSPMIPQASSKPINFSKLWPGKPIEVSSWPYVCTKPVLFWIWAAGTLMAMALLPSKSRLMAVATKAIMTLGYCWGRAKFLTWGAEASPPQKARIKGTKATSVVPFNWWGKMVWKLKWT